MTSNAAPSDKILERISKLANMTVANGCTEAEAATAAQMMQRLLFEHNISLSDVGIGKDKKAQPGIGEEYNDLEGMTETLFGNRIIRPNEREWIVDLATYVARYNFCRVMTTHTRSAVWFVGTPENVAACKEIWRYLAEQVVELANQAYKVSNKRTDHRVWKRNFSNGCTWRLVERLRENWEALQAQYVQSRALIVVNDNALNEYVEKRATAKPSKRRTGANQDGVQEGYRAGDLVSMTPGRTQIN